MSAITALYDESIESQDRTVILITGLPASGKDYI